MARKAKNIDFERALNELETLVESMEDGELSLEEALRGYERGVALSRTCQQALDAAEQRISILSQDADGEATLAPMQVDDPAPTQPDDHGAQDD
ncbi:MAG: exodeoxyribonuclease VII small subunit [Gammaproteobacteria bacterium]